jgi:hypothetical protein
MRRSAETLDILYDRWETGDYFHACAQPFAGRFFF